VRPEREVDVSVIVPCRNEIRHIRAFLDSLLRQETAELKVEVVIADGLSHDGTRQVLADFQKEHANIHIIDNPEKIVSTGANRAIRQARGEIIIRMDVHTTYAPDYVRSCVKALKETGAGNVGGPALTSAQGYIPETIAHGFHAPFATGGAKFRDPSYEGPVASVPYGCFRKSTLERVGLYDEDLVCGQDVELNFRITASGETVWQSPKIRSWYTPRATFPKLIRQHFQYGFWKIGILRKHRQVLAWRNAAPATCLLAGLGLLSGLAAADLCGAVALRNAFLIVLLLSASAYVVVSLSAAIGVARRQGWRFLPVLPVVFAAYQFPYALGSLLALLYRPTLGRAAGPIRKVLMATSR